MPCRRTSSGFARLLQESHRALVGRPLVDGTVGATRLYQAPFCLLAHDASADPLFIYANEAAQRCFDYDWDAFLRIPSRLSVEGSHEGERQHLLQEVERVGFVENYAGVRIARSGRRFPITGVTVWNLIDAAGSRVGQAACFPEPEPGP